MSDREREVHRRVAHVLKCVLDVLRVQWNLVFIGLKLSCGFLFVGATREEKVGIKAKMSGVDIVNDIVEL